MRTRSNPLFIGAGILILLIFAGLQLSKIEFSHGVETEEVSKFMPVDSIRSKGTQYIAVIRDKRWSKIPIQGRNRRAKGFLNWAEKKRKGSTILIVNSQGKELYHTLCGEQGCFAARVPK